MSMGFLNLFKTADERNSQQPVKATSPHVGLVGQAVHVQPTTKALKKRSVMRCARLVRRLAERPDPVCYEELERRRRDLFNQGIELPKMAVEIEALGRTL